MWILLDIDGCVYDSFTAEGDPTPYRAHVRSADEAWARRVTGAPLEDLRAFRQQHAPQVGMDQSLIDFISLRTGQNHGIPELAAHRNGPSGYKPEGILEENAALISVLTELQSQGNKIAIVSDNPAARRTARQIGISSTIVPEEYIFDAARLGHFKDQKFFEEVLRELKVAPADAIAIGDSERSDIAPARAAGIKAYLVANATELVARLNSFAI